MDLFHVAYNEYVWKALFLYRHPERSRGIFLAEGDNVVCVIAEKGKPFAKGARKSRVQGRFLDYARNDEKARREALSKICGASIFYAPHHHFAFLISNFSFKRSFQTESKDGTPQGPTSNPQCPLSIYFHSTPCISNNYLFFQFGILEIHASKKTWRK